jgi:hypothetical protein
MQYEERAGRKFSRGIRARDNQYEPPPQRLRVSDNGELSIRGVHHTHAPWIGVDDNPDLQPPSVVSAIVQAYASAVRLEGCLGRREAENGTWVPAMLSLLFHQKGRCE